jgi:signal transduction histidine kinase
MPLERRNDTVYEDLRESEMRLRALSDNLPGGMVYQIDSGVDGQERRFTYVSAGVELLHGISVAEALADPMKVYGQVVAADRLLVANNEAEALRTMSAFSVEVHCELPSGEIRWRRFTSAPRRLADGCIVWDGIEIDITENQKLLEAALRADKLEATGTLAGGIAHDFNNFLSAILLNIELAKIDSEPGGLAVESLEQAEKACLLARNLAKQLITFSSGGAPVRKPTSLRKLLLEGPSIPLSGSNVKSEFEIPDDLWSAEVDEGQIMQVLSNLCINAVHAMPEGGLLRIRARNVVLSEEPALPLRAGRYIGVVIEDQGIGIKKEYLSKIFDPYFTTKQKGSGLGLSVVHSVVHKHGGYVFAESELGIGTRFQIYLPACEAEPRDENSNPNILLSGEGRILVMDDEEVVRDTVVTSLKRLGYEVEFAKDGEEAIEIYRQALDSGKPFDAVILDLTVPGGMGGREAVARLLEMDPGTKAIVTSGYSDDPVMADCERYGFVARIPKPLAMGLLSETLHNVIAMVR